MLDDDNSDQREIILFHGEVRAEDTDEGVPDVKVSAFQSGIHIGTGTSNLDGEVEVKAIDPKSVRELCKDSKNEKYRKLAYDLYFCQPLSDRGLGKRPVEFNRQGLYCEGRSLDLERQDVPNEIRYIQKAIQLRGQSQALIDELLKRKIDVLNAISKFNVVVVTGSPGVGKSTFLAILLEHLKVAPDYFEQLACHSFEMDSSSRFFEQSIRYSLETNNLPCPKKPDDLIAQLSKTVSLFPPTLFLVDGIDEVSNSSLDRGWGNELKNLAHEVVRGMKTNNGKKHKMILTARGFPRFLKSERERIGEVSL